MIEQCNCNKEKFGAWAMLLCLGLAMVGGVVLLK